MSMMRRGPLDRYPVDWVLGEAAAQRVSGSIEINASRSATFYLRNGVVYQAVAGLAPTALGASAPRVAPDEDARAARHRVVGLLTAALPIRDGWYFIDPLAESEDDEGWEWPVAGLLDAARARAKEDKELGRWAAASLTLLAPGDDRSVTTSSDAWAVVVALAQTAPAAEVRGQLGWGVERMTAALDELRRAGTLAPIAGARPGDRVDTSPPAPVAAPPAVPATRRPVLPERPTLAPALAGGLPGPVAAPAAPGDGDGDRRSALRRLIGSLRSS